MAMFDVQHRTSFADFFTSILYFYSKSKFARNFPHKHASHPLTGASCSVSFHPGEVGEGDVGFTNYEVAHSRHGPVRPGPAANRVLFQGFGFALLCCFLAPERCNVPARVRLRPRGPSAFSARPGWSQASA